MNASMNRKILRQNYIKNFLLWNNFDFFLKLLIFSLSTSHSRVIFFKEETKENQRRIRADNAHT